MKAKVFLILLFMLVGVALAIDIATRIIDDRHIINEDESLNPIDHDSVVLFQDSCMCTKTIQYRGHRYIMTRHDFIHDPDCPCYEVGDEHHEY